MHQAHLSPVLQLLLRTTLLVVLFVGGPSHAASFDSVSELSLGPVALSSGGLTVGTTSAPGGVTVFGGDTSTGTAGVLITTDPTIGAGATIDAGGTNGVGAVVVGSGGTLQPGAGATINLNEDGTNVYTGTGGSASTGAGTINGLTVGTPGNPMNSAADAIAADVSTIATLAGGTPDAVVDGSAGGMVNSSRTGYTVINVTSQLTGILTLEAGDPSDYFFVYLSGGIVTGGSVQFASSLDPRYVDPIASNVIVALAGTSSTISTTTQGSYLASSGTIAMSRGATVVGGVFMANTSTTTAAEIMMTSGVLITPHAWNGLISSAAPEPAAASAMASGLVGLLLLRRRGRTG